MHEVTKAEKAFDRSWRAFGPKLCDLIDKVADLPEAHDFNFDEVIEIIGIDATRIADGPTLWAIALIVEALARVEDGLAYDRQAKLPSNVIDMAAALRGIKR